MPANNFRRRYPTLVASISCRPHYVARRNFKSKVSFHLYFNLHSDNKFIIRCRVRFFAWEVKKSRFETSSARGLKGSVSIPFYEMKEVQSSFRKVVGPNIIIFRRLSKSKRTV